jgi:AraC-like DNA-binding protein
MPQPTKVSQPVDVLAEILDAVRLQEGQAEALNAPAEFGGDGLEAGGKVVIFVQRAGQCVGSVAGGPIELAAGDALALLRVSDRWKLTFMPSPPDAHGEFLRPSGLRETGRAAGGALSFLRCSCRFADPEQNLLFRALPQVLHVRNRQWPDFGWFEPTNAWIEVEAALQRPGAGVVINRLIELLWVQLVRTHVVTTPSATHGWLRALSDAQIGGALSMIHAQPATQFTVAGLAHAVGMSRSAFASLFAHLVGEPPLRYIVRWRMLKASQLLRGDSHALSDVAAIVGYESEAAFSKAFKRWSGQAPGTYRRARRQESVLGTQSLPG